MALPRRQGIQKQKLTPTSDNHVRPRLIVDNRASPTIGGERISGAPLRQQPFNVQIHRGQPRGLGRGSDRDSVRRSRRATDRQQFDRQIEPDRTTDTSDGRHQTIDQRRRTESLEDTTAAQLQKQTEESGKEWEQHQVYVAEQDRQKRVRSFTKKRNPLQAVADRRGSIKGSAKIVRIVRPTWIAVSIAFPLYCYQLIFGIIALIGIALEADIKTESDSILTNVITWALSFVLDGEELFSFGWIFSSLLGVISLVLVTSIYMLHGIKPFRGKGLSTFGIVLSLTIMPFAIVPWTFVWIFFVFKGYTSNNT